MEILVWLIKSDNYYKHIHMLSIPYGIVGVDCVTVLVSMGGLVILIAIGCYVFVVGAILELTVGQCGHYFPAIYSGS